MSDNYSKLKSKLNDEQKEVLEKYLDCVNDYVLLISEQSFCDGFCLGTKISAEALIVSEQPTWFLLTFVCVSDILAM